MHYCVFKNTVLKAQQEPEGHLGDLKIELVPPLKIAKFTKNWEQLEWGQC